MAQRYDVISERYEQVKALPVGLAEQGTLLAALPGLAGLSVLDVGCGTGFYTRVLRQRGARHVVGVDAEPAMVDLARRAEQRAPLGVSYRVHDAAALPVLGDFDVVTAVWLLGYAADVAALDRMLVGLTANLAPAGTLVALVPNPELDWDRLAVFPRYGLSISRTDVVDGRQGSVVRLATEPPIEIAGRSWPPGAVETALRRAGLAQVRRHPVVVPDDAVARFGADFWADLLRNPTFAVFTARRPATDRS